MQTVKFLKASKSSSGRHYAIVRVYEVRNHPIAGPSVTEYNGSFQIGESSPLLDSKEWPEKSQKEIEGLTVRTIRTKDGGYQCVSVRDQETDEIVVTDIRELELVFPDAE